MADLKIFGTTFTNVPGIKAEDSNGNTATYIQPTGSISITENGENIDVSGYASATVNVPGGTSDYNQLSNRPQINSVTLTGDKSASDLGLATTAQVNAKYSKPSGGIPKSDLASDVQTSLGKADTALQSAPVTSVNGQTGAVTIGNATTSVAGLMSATDKSHLDDVYADYSSALAALGV